MTRRKKETRARLAGISVRRERRRITALADNVRLQFQELAYRFADVDGTVSGLVDTLLAGLERFEGDLNDVLAYLSEVPYDD